MPSFVKNILFIFFKIYELSWLYTKHYVWFFSTFAFQWILYNWSFQLPPIKSFGLPELVTSFEPDPFNIRFKNEHLDIRKCVCVLVECIIISETKVKMMRQRRVSPWKAYNLFDVISLTTCEKMSWDLCRYVGIVN